MLLDIVILYEEEKIFQLILDRWYGQYDLKLELRVMNIELFIFLRIFIFSPLQFMWEYWRFCYKLSNVIEFRMIFISHEFEYYVLSCRNEAAFFTETSEG